MYDFARYAGVLERWIAAKGHRGFQYATCILFVLLSTTRIGDVVEDYS